MGQVKIKRKSEWANKKFPYKVVLDGHELCEISSGEERIITIDKPGTIQAKLRWGGSDKVDMNEAIKEVKISANRWTNIAVPGIAMLTLFVFGLINFMYPDNEANGFITALLTGFVIGGIGLLTIWNNRFIDIELIAD